MKLIDLESLIDWDEHFLNQAVQSGNGYYSGENWQRGSGLGSIFRSFIRFLSPLGKTIGKAVGREALRTGANIAGDLLDGQKLGKSAEYRLTEGAKHLMNQASAHMGQQSGSGKKRGRPKGKTNKKKSKPKKKKAVSRPRVKRAKLLLSDDIFD